MRNAWIGLFALLAACAPAPTAPQPHASPVLRLVSSRVGQGRVNLGWRITGRLDAAASARQHSIDVP